MQSEPWSPHYRFCTNFSHFCLMTRFLRKIWNDMPGVQKSFVHFVFSQIPSTKTFHKHGFLLAVSHFPYHGRIATQLLTSQGPVTWPFDREQHSLLGEFFLAKIFFSVVFHMLWTIEKREKFFCFSGTLTGKNIIKFQKVFLFCGGISWNSVGNEGHKGAKNICLRFAMHYQVWPPLVTCYK